MVEFRLYQFLLVKPCKPSISTRSKADQSRIKNPWRLGVSEPTPCTSWQVLALQLLWLHVLTETAAEHDTYVAVGQNPGTPGEHQNSWDLWMFIPLKMVLIGT